MGEMKMKKFLMVGILMALGIFTYGNFALAVPVLITDSFNDETKIASKDNIFVDTALGQVKADKIFLSRLYGGGSEDFFLSAYADNNYIYAVGNTFSEGAGVWDALIVKFNKADLSIASRKVYGGGTWEDFNSVYADDNYIYAVGATGGDALIVKFNKADLSIASRKVYGGGGNDYFYSVYTDDNYIYAVGSTKSEGAGFWDALIVKFNKADLSIVSRKVYGGGTWEKFNSVYADDNYVYAVGHAQSEGAGLWDALIVKFNKADLSIASRKVYGGGGNDVFYSVYADDNYVYAVGSEPSAGWDMALIVKFNKADLSIASGKVYSGVRHDEFYSVYADDNYIYAAGWTQSEGAGFWDALIVKFNKADLSIASRKVYGGGGNDYFYSVYTDNNYIYAVGNIYPDGAGFWDASITKFNKDLPSGIYNSNPSGFTFQDSNLTLADSGLTLADSGLTLADSGLTLADSGLTLADSGLTLSPPYKSYYLSGTLISNNLLSVVTDIGSFDYDISSIPANTGLKVQFSRDNSNWYNSAGVLNAWNTLSQGIHSIDLSPLSWSTNSFYYKTEFISDSSGTSVLDEISVAGTADPVTVTIEAEDKNGVLIPDGGAIWDYDNNDSITITSVATANVGGEAIWFHGIHFTIGGNAYNVACGSVGTCSVDICTVPGVDCSADLVAGAVVTYSSTAVDTAINIGSSVTKSFSVGTTWAKVFTPTVESDNIFSIHQTSDGGYIGGGAITNWKGSLPGDFIRPLILKLDKDGTQEWVREVVPVDNWDVWNNCRFAEQTFDGGYILTTDTNFYGGGNSDILVLKLNSSGVKQWSKVFGNLSHNQNTFAGGLIRQTSEGGYIIGGHSTFAGKSMSVIKLDSLGNKVWAKAFGTLGNEEIEFVQQTDDNGDGVKDDGYIVIATGETLWMGDQNFLVIKLDSSGNKVWAKSYGSPGGGWENPHQIQQTIDGGYIMIGRTTSYGAGGIDLFVVKIDALGNQKWSKTFGTSDEEGRFTSSIQQTVDGGYIIGTRLKSVISKGLVIKLDSSGDKVWAKTYGDPAAISSDIYFIEQTSDGGYITTGQTSYAFSNSEALILKLDNNGNIANCDSIITDVTGSIIESLKFMTGVTNHIGYNGVNDGSMNEPGGNPSNENLLVTGEIDPCGPCNTAPTVNAGAAVQPANYCGKAPQANLHWVFADADVGDSQGHFQVQVDDDAGFGSPIIDTGKLPGSANSYNTSLFITLAYNITYHWRVKVWDDQVPDAGSVYSTGTSFLTPLHKYPCADFTFSPASPLAGDIVDFDASAEGPCSCSGIGSQAYGGASITDYSWDFDGDSIIDASGALPIANYTYIAEGNYSIELIVTDSSGFSCPSCAQTINVGKGMPKWKEVVPR